MNETFYRDILVWLAAFFGTLIVGVLQGVFISCALSLGILVYNAVFPPIIQLGRFKLGPRIGSLDKNVPRIGSLPRISMLDVNTYSFTSPMNINK